MRSRLAGALAGSLLLVSLCAAPSALAAAHRVNVRVEGTHRTLIDTTLKSLPGGSIVKDGNPAHSCAGSSALGALDAAPGGFTATWYDGLGYAVQSIKGESHTFSGNSYWAFWINDKVAPTGLCGYTPKTGDRLLFFPDCASKGCKSVTPLGVRVRHSARAHRRFRVRVVSFTANGKAHAVRGAHVRVGHHRARTDRKGYATLRIAKRGRYAVRATARGHVRSERESIRIRR